MERKGVKLVEKTISRERLLPKIFRGDLGHISFGDVAGLYRAIGCDYAGLCQRADALKTKRTRHLEQRMRAIREEIDYRTIWSKLFTEEGKLKYFVGVAELAKRDGVTTSAVRRRIAKGELSAVKGYKQLFIDTRKLSPEAAA